MMKEFFILFKTLLVVFMSFLITDYISVTNGHDAGMVMIENEIEEEEDNSIASKFCLAEKVEIDNGGLEDIVSSDQWIQESAVTKFFSNNYYTKIRSYKSVTNKRPFYILHCSLIVYS